jgi:hypothetical protein
MIKLEASLPCRLAPTWSLTSRFRLALYATELPDFHEAMTKTSNVIIISRGRRGNRL